MSSEDLEKYETEMELQLYREYRDVVGLFTHVVETERRFYLANSVDLKVRSAGGDVQGRQRRRARQDRARAAQGGRLLGLSTGGGALAPPSTGSVSGLCRWPQCCHSRPRRWSR